MPEQMPERDAAFIEAECLKAVRQAWGCKDTGQSRSARSSQREAAPIGRC